MILSNGNNQFQGQFSFWEWSAPIHSGLNEYATIGNANSGDDDCPLGVVSCERIELAKAAKICEYRK